MKKILALALASIMSLSLVACSSTDTTTTTTTTESTETETKAVLTVGTEAKYAPYEFVMLDEDGKEVFAGFDMDLAREIADDLGMELKIVDLPFDSLMLDLQAGNIDMAIAALSPKAEREEAADFSMSYYEAEQAIVIRVEDAGLYTDELSFTGVQVAGQTGSIQADYINDDMTGSIFIGYTDIPTMVTELEAKNVSAAVVEAPVIEALLADHPELMILKTFIDEDTQGNVVCVQKGNEEMLASVNATIERLMADGTMDQYVVDAFNNMGLAIE